MMFDGVSAAELSAIGSQVFLPRLRDYCDRQEANPYGQHLDAHALFHGFLRLVERDQRAKGWIHSAAFDCPLPHSFLPAIAQTLVAYVEAVKRNILELTTSLNLTSTEILTDALLREEVLSHAYPHSPTADARRARQ
jgi:hypothetical protein